MFFFFVGKPNTKYTSALSISFQAALIAMLCMHTKMLHRNALQFWRYNAKRLRLTEVVLGASVRSFTDYAYLHRVGNEPLLYQNIGQKVQEAAEKYGKRPAIISCHEKSTLSFVEAKHQAETLALHLKDLGLAAGDHLGIWAPNTIQWYIAFLAAGMAGLPLVCLNMALQAQDMAYALKKAKVKALITMDICGKQNFYKILRRLLPHACETTQRIACGDLPHLHFVLMKSTAESVANDFIDYEVLMQKRLPAHDVVHLNAQVPLIAPEAPCNIQFTSGTTGKPKAALLTHFSYVNEGHYFGQRLNLHECHKHICMTVPMFHAFGLSVTMGALDYGATLVLPSVTFNAIAALQAIHNEKCNVVLGTPTMYVDMLEAQRRRKLCLNSLEIGLVGGAACTPELYHNVKEVLGVKYMRIGYGLSEATAAIFAQEGTQTHVDSALTVGRLFEHGEAKVINAAGETVRFGEAGELCVRGYFNMKGYFEDEEKTNEVLGLDGWLRTGDEFVLQSTGVGSILGRKKDLIIRGGENIFPKEIEDFLATHKSIMEAQVVGVPDERMGEELCAFLRLKPNAADLNVEDIKSFCQGQLAHFKIPRYVQLIEEFPKTISGKIQKFKLTEMFMERQA